MAAKPMTPERLAEQKPVVEKATKSRMLNKYDGVLLGGNNISNERIVKSIAGELKNTHNSVFKNCMGKTACEHCGIVERLDRAHMRSKIDIATEALDEIHTNLLVPIDMKLFMVEFVKRHANIGVWMLCKKCHRQLG